MRIVPYGKAKHMLIGLVILAAVVVAFVIFIFFALRISRHRENEEKLQRLARNEAHQQKVDELDAMLKRLRQGHLEVLEQIEPYREMLHPSHRFPDIQQVALNPEKFFALGEEWMQALKGRDVAAILDNYIQLKETCGVEASNNILSARFGKKIDLRHQTQERVNRLQANLIQSAERSEDKTAQVGAILGLRYIRFWHSVTRLHSTEQIKRPALPSWWNEEVTQIYPTPGVADFDWRGIEMGCGEWTSWAAETMDSRDVTAAKMILAQARTDAKIRSEIGEILYAALAIIANAPDTATSILARQAVQAL